MKENLNDLRAFVTVAQAGSFTKAAQQVGVSQSALSHTIRGMESRLKVKLLQRTTRSVSTTEAGERLFQKLLPLFDGIDSAMNDLGETDGEVRGRLRINGTEHVFNVVLRDKFMRFMQ
ncbi:MULTISPECIES: LysR family transcriptional regulator [Eikenella]|uniref:LysR family transcriptional regulator n=1 Tax=Eikenella TaxID=538 RepID=UPI000A912832|nr:MULTISPECIES: LysR family transcriptional regulator [Eikenella]